MKRRSNFTLVELMVAMGVFVVLLMVSMQIFGGARKLWVRSEQKNSAFAAARTAMEFVAARLQTCVYMDEMPFELKAASSSASHYESVFFATTIPMNRKDDNFNLRFIKFAIEEVKIEESDECKKTGVLKMRIVSDHTSGDFAKWLPPYRKHKGPNYKTACGKINDKFDKASGKDSIDIIENVTSFKLFAYNMSAKRANAKLKKDTIDAKTQMQNTPPYLLEIEISVIDSKENYKKWDKAGKDEKKEIETESGYTFRRAVLLGDWRYR